MSEPLISFFLGVAVVSCIFIGAIFVQFWRRTNDSLFIMFALAFWLFGVNWAMVALLRDEVYAAVYLFRLIGFLLIIVGVIGKNRRSRGTQP